MKINKMISLALLLIGLATLSCSDQASTLEGTYVREIPLKNPDTMIITHLKNNLYQIEARQWKNGLKKSKSTTGTLDKNKIYFENGKAIELTEDNEFVVKSAALVYHSLPSFEFEQWMSISQKHHATCVIDLMCC